jgi:hypothetical protein
VTFNIIQLVLFVAGLVPATLMMLTFGIKTAWWVTAAGRMLFGFVLVTVMSYGLGVVILIWPKVLQPESTVGLWVRIVIRALVAAVLWYMFVVYLATQRRNRKALDEERTAHQ